MIQLTLTEEQQAILSASRELVEIVDRRGRILTRVKSNWTDEEIDEILRKGAESGIATESLFELTERLRREYPIPSELQEKQIIR